MSSSENRIVTAEFVGGGKGGPDEMFDSVLGGEFEKPDSPVELGFFADGETVQVYECDVDSLEGGVESCFVVAGAGNDGYIWEGGELDGGWGGGGAG